MSSLDKLAIRGIRSFDSNEISVMQFFSPLTVIVGHNGSGKTTIIECLKYATTGDLPPGSKGGAFVHDPTIAGTSEVKAQVKLRFNNTRREKMLVERRLQVTKKKTASGLSMKTLEGTISYADQENVDRKKRQTLSTKCAALDEEIPSQLGVSKAILQNVIFCHQEESNWPLSEPAALKKKFDDIFEASDYTKVLDEIKRLRKDQTVEIKVDKEKLAALKTDRDRAFKLRENVKKVSSVVAAKEVAHADLEERIEKLVRDNKTFFNQASKYQDILGKVDTLREKRKLHEDNLEQLQSGVKELRETDAELNAKIENHRQSLDDARAERESTRTKLSDEQDAMAAYERKRSQAQTSHGRLQAMKQRHLDLVEARKVLVRDLSEKHNIPGFNRELLSEADMSEFEDKLEESISGQQAKIEKIKGEARATESQYQEEIQALKSARAADDRAKRTISEQIRQASSRISALSRQLDATSTTVADITFAESALRDDQERKRSTEDALAQADYAAQLATHAKDLKQLDETRDALHGELASLNAQASTRAKLQLRRTEKARKEEAVQSLVERNRAAFKKYAKAEPSRETMEGEVNGLIATLEADLSIAERASRDATRELQIVESGVGFAKKKVKELRQSGDAARARISQGLNDADTDCKTIEAAVAEAEEEHSFRQGSITSQGAVQQFYQSILKKAKDAHVCMGCDRGFSDAELPDLERYVKRRIERAPQELVDLKHELAQWDQQLDKLKRLVPIEVNYNKIVKEEIPAAEEAAQVQEDKLAPAKLKAEEASSALNELKDRQRDLQALKKTASDVMRLHRDTVDIGRDVEKLESELSATGSTATSEEIQAKLSEIADKIRSVKVSTDKIRSEQQSATRTIQSLSSSIHAREMDLTRRRQELKDKEALETRQNDAREEVGDLEKQAKELDKRLADSFAPIRQKENDLASVRSQFQSEEAAASRELQAYNKSDEQIQLNEREIQNYISRGGDAELTKVERELEKHDALISEMKQRIANLQVHISQFDQTLADSKAVLRNFQDNIRLRREKAALVAIDDEIDQLDEDSARKAYRKFETEYNDQRRKQADLQAEQAKLGGEIETLKNDHQEKQEELNSEYKDIDDKYRRELINVKTAEMSNQDLEKLQKALDGAIMRFHGLKMKEINDTIGDLWTKTYQGTDIDKIMIKSDAEGKASGTARSYNYRVVMFKDQTEMDMRGRCSAGQKVLASIIIRLALAESFSVNCGIMALDEPTTNLDKDNIVALAGSLSDLIKERQGQSNFQLIVITHDEEFLETLGGSGVIDKYWRVSRGDGGQVSTIERQRLN
ncbi:hypothetical protein JCM11491_005685 [Sporobolomyces phaffii]